MEYFKLIDTNLEVDYYESDIVSPLLDLNVRLEILPSPVYSIPCVMNKSIEKQTGYNRYGIVTLDRIRTSVLTNSQIRLLFYYKYTKKSKINNYTQLIRNEQDLNKYLNKLETELNLIIHTETVDNATFISNIYKKAMLDIKEEFIYNGAIIVQNYPNKFERSPNIILSNIPTFIILTYKVALDFMSKYKRYVSIKNVPAYNNKVVCKRDFQYDVKFLFSNRIQF